MSMIASVIFNSLM